MSNEESNTNQPMVMFVRFHGTETEDSVLIDRKYGIEFTSALAKGNYASISRATLTGGVYSLNFSTVQRIRLEPQASVSDRELDLSI